MANDSTRSGRDRINVGSPRSLLIAIWCLVIPLVVLAAVSVVEMGRAAERHDSLVSMQEALARELEQTFSAEIDGLSRSVDELSGVLFSYGKDSVEAQRGLTTVLGQIDSTMASLQAVVQDLAAWECVHAWTEVFALERFNFDDIRGSATGQEVLDLLSDLHLSCSFQFGPFG